MGVMSHDPVRSDRLLIKPLGGGQVDADTAADSSPEGNRWRQFAWESCRSAGVEL
jgi:hypothetical protein